MNSRHIAVVGAGPVGLWLAAELALGGARPLVLERAARRSPRSKALGVHPRTLEVLAMRGLEREFLDAGVPVPSWHFGMLPTRLDFGGLATPFPFMLAHPQFRTEEILERRALELGVRIERGHTVTGLRQAADGVALEITGPSGPYTLTSDYVVGADGAGSVVRTAAGIDFPGTETSVYGYLGDVTVADPPAGPAHWHNEHGTLIVVPLPGGRFRMTGYDPARQRAEPPSLEELRETVSRISGVDFGIREASWLSSFGNATRVAARYRQGRVLLAGDAAHRHFPAGGVGLNVGLQDAMNLGWKLAAVVRGQAGPGLLDSYHAERHPVGLALAEHTMAQTALITAVDAEGQALRRAVSGWFGSQPGLARELAEQLSGLDVRYPGVGHPLVGKRFAGEFGLLREGRPVVLTELPLAEARVAAEEAGFAVRRGQAGAAVVIVRPDGHVWWAAEDSPELDRQVRRAIAELGVRFGSGAA